ncbi:hypothetical protein AB0L71_31860 [Streptomyces sp. NPDC052052]|uniref:hypothetical protein n=1 Tax=Streptomyces sp. NPDC052052 TaxID=3154756 RepID=UPI00343A2CB9
MRGRLPLGDGETSRTACARGLLRTGVDEETGELLSAAVLAERVGWCVDLVSGMTNALLGEHWNTADVDLLASGEDGGGRKLPSNAWMALRRLGWTVTAPDGVRVNDRIVRMVQTQGTLPHQPPGPGGQASGGTRSHGPAPAAPRSPPAPGRDNDQHTHRPAHATRGRTGRRLPPARPRHPTTMGTTRTRHHV